MMPRRMAGVLRKPVQVSATTMEFPGLIVSDRSWHTNAAVLRIHVFLQLGDILGGFIGDAGHIVVKDHHLRRRRGRFVFAMISLCR